MVNAVFAGSFDPPTFGHLDIIERVSSVFDSIHVIVAINREKRSLFDHPKRVDLLTECTAHLQNVRVLAWEGLVVDYALKNSCSILIRGVRNLMDFSAEYDMAMLNGQLAPDLETFLLCADPRYAALSSTAVKEFAHYGRDISALVPAPVLEAIAKKI